jgi:hypothetical protein
MAVRLAAGAIPFQVLKRVGLRTSDDIVCSACRGNIPDFGEPTRRIGSSQTVCKLRSNILTHKARPVRRSAGGSLAPVRFSRQAPDSSVLRRIGYSSRLKPPVPTTPGSKSSPIARLGERTWATKADDLRRMPSAGADVGTFSQQPPGPAQSWDTIPRIQSQIPTTILCSTASQRSRVDTLEARLARPFPGFPRATYRAAASSAAPPDEPRVAHAVADPQAALQTTGTRRAGAIILSGVGTHDPDTRSRRPPPSCAALDICRITAEFPKPGFSYLALCRSTHAVP